MRPTYTAARSVQPLLLLILLLVRTDFALRLPVGPATRATKASSDRTSVSTAATATTTGAGRRYVHAPRRPLHATAAMTEGDVDGDWLQYYSGVTGFGADYTFTINSAGRKVISSMGKEETYGEIEPRGLRVIMESTLSEQLDASDVMFDLGSGVGKVVAQFAIESECGKCVGIELGERRHKNAVLAWNELKKGGSPALAKRAEKMHFVNADMVKEKAQWTQCTVLFVNAVCYPPPLWDQLQRIIVDECSALRFLVLGGQTLGPDFLAKGFVSQDVQVAASWQDDMVMTVYSRVV